MRDDARSAGFPIFTARPFPMKASASIKKLQRFPDHDQHEVPEILADIVVTITTFKRNPAAAVQAGKGASVAVLNRGVPEFYCVVMPNFWMCWMTLLCMIWSSNGKTKNWWIWIFRLIWSHSALRSKGEWF